MTGFDTAASLRGRVGDRAGVGEFLRLFSAAWDLADRGGDLEFYAGRLEVALPAALREAYHIKGVLDPSDLEVEGGALIFHRTDPMIFEALLGVPLDAVDQPDPPVVIDTGSGWEPYVGRLSLACADLAMTAVMNHHPDRLSNAAELPPDLVGPAVAAFDRVPLPDLPMWIDVEDSPVRWYSAPGILLRTHGDDWAWLWASTQTEEDLQAVYAAIPDAEWSN